MAGVAVVKLGGEVVAAGRGAALGAGVQRLQAGGGQVVVVHGAGPQLSALQERLGLPVRKVAGRRYTDEATLQAVKQAVGQVNLDLCRQLLTAGVAAVGLTGAVQAVRRPPRVYTGAGDQPVDLGLVGDVTGFDRELLLLLWSAGRVPVLACVGLSTDGGVYNINADTVASALARGLSAQTLALVSDRPVLRDVADPRSRVPELRVAEAHAMIRSGAAQGGMVAKLEEACAALESGVGEVLITTDLLDDTTVLRP